MPAVAQRPEAEHAQLATPADSQTLSAADRSSLELQQQVLFDRMLHNPADLNVGFAYADISARLGNDEAAVTTLERMLLFRPDLASIDLELGTLYFRMGSFEVAQTYFEKAMATHPSPEVAARARRYLGAIASRESPYRIVGQVLLGTQYQSDANVAPASTLLQSQIGTIPLARQFVKQGAASTFAAGSILYSYDLGTQDRDTFEVGGAALVNHYFNLGRLDVDFGEVTAGPRFRFPDTALSWAHSASLKPYAIVDEVGLGGQQYFYTLGTGLEGTAVLARDVSARVVFEFRQKKFSDAPDRPFSKGLSGSDKLIWLVLSKPITSNSTLGAELGYLDQGTRYAFYGNKTYALGASYRVRYADPTGTLSLPWKTTFYANHTWSYYGAPDPCCDSSGPAMAFSPSTRRDSDWRIGISQSFPITETAALVVRLQRDVVSSNLQLYAYTNNSALLGAEIRF
ncbi:MAG TPA: tetratricopeptide repeat protein [Candidatus Binataceae bacterium]|nr:tetratricopeptide repeat protein [Candidatus Binataceae bacterium]